MTTISDRVHKLTTAPITETVSSLLARDPSLSPGDANDKLYPQHSPSIVSALKSGKCKEPEELSAAELERAYQCGRWGGKRPSDLFLKCYHAALQPLDSDIRAGVVSPPYMGSHGVIPVSISSIIPDIMRHYANLIVHSEHEIILATNYWAASAASSIIVSALHKLSEKCVKEGRKVVVKILYDRGNIKQIVENHVKVTEDIYTAKEVLLPHQSEVPGLDLEVVNFHVPPVGTFHAKWMVVDRRIAVLNSNNIQDVPNFEMMTHYEGPIVDSFYDMALISWHCSLEPVLPCIANPPVREGEQYGFANNTILSKEEGETPLSGQMGKMNINQQPAGQNPDLHAHFAGQTNPFPMSSSQRQEASSSNPDAIPIPASQAHDTPTAPREHLMVSSETQEASGNQQNLQAAQSSQSSTPQPSAIQFDDTYAAEAQRVKDSLKTLEDITNHLNTTIQPNTRGTAPADIDISKFSPYKLHPKHETFPIALVNRVPHGPPGHQSVHTPQNAAWLAGIHHAQSSIFIQTPDLNSVPLMDALILAVKRGIKVTLWLCLGYNDSGELLPFQGGTNEMVVNTLYKGLEEGEKEGLCVCWYTAKDQERPISARTKKRTCHVKIMCVDGAVGIQGSGNQDTQSWYHSQETNCLIDSPLIVSQWLQLLHDNQNTAQYGQVDISDGQWRRDGKTLDNTSGGNEGHFAWVKGIKGAVERVQGKGGF